MPELPEVQAHAERLTDGWAGRSLTTFTPLTFTAMKTAVPDPSLAVGEPLRSVGRRGKMLLLDFGTLTFAVHLMQGGRLTPEVKRSQKPRGGLARWTFDDATSWLLTEQGTEKRAGVWTDPDAATAGLGPEALDLDAAALRARFAEHPMRLHGFLRDQHAIAGLGRRLANEVCWRARLSPFAATAKLDDAQAAAVVDAIAAAVADGLEYERSRSEMSKSADRPGAVHHRTGEPCPRCGDTIREVAYSAYTVHYCPTCQTGGKVLADNTTSKFLR